MRYRYQCTDENCGQVLVLARPLAARNEPAECPTCGMPATRIFTVPNVNAGWTNSPEFYENKYAEGVSQTEISATRAADDARYAQSWGL